jgi:hypothetical protein
MYRYTVTALAFVVTAMAAEAGTTTVTDAGAKNLGSSAAYVATCEKEGLLATGTLADFILRYNKHSLVNIGRRSRRSIRPHCTKRSSTQ